MQGPVPELWALPPCGLTRAFAATSAALGRLLSVMRLTSLRQRAGRHGFCLHCARQSQLAEWVGFSCVRDGTTTLLSHYIVVRHQIGNGEVSGWGRWLRWQACYRVDMSSCVANRSRLYPSGIPIRHK